MSHDTDVSLLDVLLDLLDVLQRFRSQTLLNIEKPHSYDGVNTVSCVSLSTWDMCAPHFNYSAEFIIIKKLSSLCHAIDIGQFKHDCLTLSKLHPVDSTLFIKNDELFDSQVVDSNDMISQCNKLLSLIQIELYEILARCDETISGIIRWLCVDMLCHLCSIHECLPQCLRQNFRGDLKKYHLPVLSFILPLIRNIFSNDILKSNLDNICDWIGIPKKKLLTCTLNNSLMETLTHHFKNDSLYIRSVINKTPSVIPIILNTRSYNFIKNEINEVIHQLFLYPNTIHSMTTLSRDPHNENLVNPCQKNDILITKDTFWLSPSEWRQRQSLSTWIVMFEMFVRDSFCNLTLCNTSFDVPFKDLLIHNLFDRLDDMNYFMMYSLCSLPFSNKLHESIQVSSQLSLKTYPVKSAVAQTTSFNKKKTWDSLWSGWNHDDPHSKQSIIPLDINDSLLYHVVELDNTPMTDILSCMSLCVLKMNSLDSEQYNKTDSQISFFNKFSFKQTFPASSADPSFSKQQERHFHYQIQKDDIHYHPNKHLIHSQLFSFLRTWMQYHQLMLYNNKSDMNSQCNQLCFSQMFCTAVSLYCIRLLTQLNAYLSPMDTLTINESRDQQVPIWLRDPIYWSIQPNVFLKDIELYGIHDLSSTGRPIPSQIIAQHHLFQYLEQIPIMTFVTGASSTSNQLFDQITLDYKIRKFQCDKKKKQLFLSHPNRLYILLQDDDEPFASLYHLNGGSGPYQTSYSWQKDMMIATSIEVVNILHILIEVDLKRHQFNQTIINEDSLLTTFFPILLSILNQSEYIYTSASLQLSILKLFWTYKEMIPCTDFHYYFKRLIISCFNLGPTQLCRLVCVELFCFIQSTLHTTSYIFYLLLPGLIKLVVYFPNELYNSFNHSFSALLDYLLNIVHHDHKQLHTCLLSELIHTIIDIPIFGGIISHFGTLNCQVYCQGSIDLINKSQEKKLYDRHSFKINPIEAFIYLKETIHSDLCLCFPIRQLLYYIYSTGVGFDWIPPNFILFSQMNTLFKHTHRILLLYHIRLRLINYVYIWSLQHINHSTAIILEEGLFKIIIERFHMLPGEEFMQTQLQYHFATILYQVIILRPSIFIRLYHHISMSFVSPFQLPIIPSQQQFFLPVVFLFTLRTYFPNFETLDPHDQTTLTESEYLVIVNELFDAIEAFHTQYIQFIKHPVDNQDTPKHVMNDLIHKQDCPILILPIGSNQRVYEGQSMVLDTYHRSEQLLFYLNHDDIIPLLKQTLYFFATHWEHFHSRVIYCLSLTNELVSLNETVSPSQKELFQWNQQSLYDINDDDFTIPRWSTMWLNKKK